MAEGGRVPVRGHYGGAAALVLAAALAGCGIFGGDDVETLNESPLGITLEITEDGSLDEAQEIARDHCRRHAARPILGYTAFEDEDRQVAFYECR